MWEFCHLAIFKATHRSIDLKFYSYTYVENSCHSAMHSEILTVDIVQIAAVQVFDMRPYLDLLSHLLMLQDSWQGHRVNTALKGQSSNQQFIVTITIIATRLNSLLSFCVIMKALKCETLGVHVQLISHANKQKDVAT